MVLLPWQRRHTSVYNPNKIQRNYENVLHVVANWFLFLQRVNNYIPHMLEIAFQHQGSFLEYTVQPKFCINHPFRKTKLTYGESQVSTEVIFLRVVHVENWPLGQIFYTWNTFSTTRGSFFYVEKWPLSQFFDGVIIRRFTGLSTATGPVCSRWYPLHHAVKINVYPKTYPSAKAWTKPDPLDHDSGEQDKSSYDELQPPFKDRKESPFLKEDWGFERTKGTNNRIWKVTFLWVIAPHGLFGNISSLAMLINGTTVQAVWRFAF